MSKFVGVLILFVSNIALASHSGELVYTQDLGFSVVLTCKIAEGKVSKTYTADSVTPAPSPVLDVEWTAKVPNMERVFELLVDATTGSLVDYGADKNAQSASFHGILQREGWATTEFVLKDVTVDANIVNTSESAVTLTEFTETVCAQEWSQ